MRRIAAIAVAKAAAALSRRIGAGGGTALPGVIAQRLEPGIVAGVAAQLGEGCVLITGTNGKTTTSRLLRSILQAGGYLPVANRAGSNMMRGLAAALVEAAGPLGNIPQAARRIGVFEVDEATLPQAAQATRPRAIVFTNLFRDQLDRYGEVERVASIWRAIVAALPNSTTLVLNADDPAIAALAAEARGEALFYGVSDKSVAVEVMEHASDARWCSTCGSELAYRAVYYGHIGLWACPGCGTERPQTQLEATRIETAEADLRLTITVRGSPLELKLPLLGLYNAYNLLAAVAAASALGLPPEAIAEGVGGFRAGFGRQERLEIEGRQVQVILAKNPAGLNQVLRTICADDSPKRLLLFLNDGLADGRDVSWIWDVDFEWLAGKVAFLLVSGNRAADLALRLKYAGLEGSPQIEKDAAAALRGALAATPQGETIYVIPTYTALLTVRDLLARWAKRGRFWEDS